MPTSRLKIIAAALAAGLAATLVVTCAGPVQEPAAHRKLASGLVALPCAPTGPLQPVTRGYCAAGRHYVKPAARAVLVRVAQEIAREHPGAVVRYMEASWASGARPMPPHLSHGDGREIDLAVFYQDRHGRPLAGPPTASGYGGFEPPLKSVERVCVGVGGNHAKPDPPAGRSWRLDAGRTADLLKRLAAEPGVRRIFVEPHLKRRLGFAREAKVRFAGCQAARHDDHLHVDFV